MAASGPEPRLLLADESVVIDELERLIERWLIVAAVVCERRGILEQDLVVERKLVPPEQVSTADLGAIDPELFGGEVEEPLDHEHAVLTARAAHGRHNRLVGEDRRELALVVGNLVGAKQGALAVDRHGETVGVVCAGIVQEHVAHAEDLPALVQRDLRVVDLAALLRGSEEVLLPILGPLDGAAELHGGPRHQHLLRVVHHDLRAEPAPDERRDDADLRFEEPEQLGQPVPDRYGRLRGVPYRQLFRAGVPLRRHGPVLDSGGRSAVVPEAALDHRVSALLGARVVTLSLDRMGRDVRGQVLVHSRCSFRERGLEVDDRGERLRLHHDVVQRVLGQVAALRHDHGHRLADVAQLLFCEWDLRAGVEHEPRDRGGRHE